MSEYPNTTHLAELQEFLRIPSISAQPQYRLEMLACAGWLEKKFRSMGLAAEVWEGGGHPAVVARSRPDPVKPTILIYGHYDVQPVEPLGEWTSPPFEPTIREKRIFARGATDNKGQLYCHIAGVESMLRNGGGLPANVIFLVEGEEEIGSPSLGRLVRQNRDLLRCDAVIISDSGMVAPGFPTLAYTLRGVAALECVVRGPARDLHSGVYGGAVMNPLSAAAGLIAGLHDARGRVLIPGFYDKVLPLEDWERAEMAAAPTGEAQILAETGAPELFGEEGFSAVERIGARPTAEVNGMGGGYQGEGSKTVIPREAFFKLTFRLVPGQRAAEILELASHYLARNCPPGVTLEIQRGHAGEAYAVDPRSVWSRAVQRALERTFGRQTVLMREGGSIPILGELSAVLGVDCHLAALAAPDCNAHSPDENFPLENLGAGIRLSRAIIEEAGGVPLRGDISPEVFDRTSRSC